MTDAGGSEPTPRQVLYALVSGGLVVVVVVLVIGAGVAGLVPVWWTALSGAMTLLWAVWTASHWRRTAVVLAGSIGLLAMWAVVTLLAS
jgi:hypothetical protein